MKTMLLRSRTTVVAILAAFALAGSAYGADQLTRLAVAKDRLVVGSQSVKPSQSIRMKAKAAQLQKLIDDARVGKRLDASEIDRAIERSYRGF